MDTKQFCWVWGVLFGVHQMKDEDYSPVLSSPLCFHSPFFHLLWPHTTDLSHLLSTGAFSSSSSPWCSHSFRFFSSLFFLPHLPPISPSLLHFLSRFMSSTLFFCLSLLPPLPPPHSLALFPYVVEVVEPFVGTPRRRPISFCPCCSPEGNVIYCLRCIWLLQVTMATNHREPQSWAPPAWSPETSPPSPPPHPLCARAQSISSCHCSVSAIVWSHYIQHYSTHFYVDIW